MSYGPANGAGDVHLMPGKLENFAENNVIPREKFLAHICNGVVLYKPVLDVSYSAPVQALSAPF